MILPRSKAGNSLQGVFHELGILVRDNLAGNDIRWIFSDKFVWIKDIIIHVMIRLDCFIALPMIGRLDSRERLVVIIGVLIDVLWVDMI